MQVTSELIPSMIKAAALVIDQNADEVTVLDQTLGDGDHVTNLQRGLEALIKQSDELSVLSWGAGLQKMGMTLLSTMGGASGSLFGTLFISMGKAVDGRSELTRQDFADVFLQGVEAVKKRGKADAGEKTMLDVLIPVANYMVSSQSLAESDWLDGICQTAETGMQSTKDMLATKGRASYMEEKSLGHIDAGARTSQLMICAVVESIKEALQN